VLPCFARCQGHQPKFQSCGSRQVTRGYCREFFTGDIFLNERDTLRKEIMSEHGTVIVYLARRSVAQRTQCRLTECLVDNELEWMWKEVVVA